MPKDNKLFYFNPEHEMAVANGSPYYIPPGNILKMAEDLAYLPAYFTFPGDGILLPAYPDENFLEERRKIFGLSPEIVLMQETDKIADYTLEPWGKNPRFYHLFKKSFSDPYDICDKEIFSRKNTVECLNIMHEKGVVHLQDLIPDIGKTVGDVMEIAKKYPIVVKAPWSSSGKGQLRLMDGQIHDKEKEWLNGILNKQGYVMIEKWLNKIEDFAMQFSISREGMVYFHGYSAFLTGTHGQYIGNFISSDRDIEKMLYEWIEQDYLTSLKEIMPDVLSQLYAGKYTGLIGVDMMIYRDKRGDYLLHPCVEINLRYNMGVLAATLYSRFFHSGTSSFFTIDFFPKQGDALKKHHEYLETFPLTFQEEKIVSGYINLTPITDQTKFLAMIKPA